VLGTETVTALEGVDGMETVDALAGVLGTETVTALEGVDGMETVDVLAGVEGIDTFVALEGVEGIETVGRDFFVTLEDDVVGIIPAFSDVPAPATFIMTYAVPKRIQARKKPMSRYFVRS
jgi:hypothetical protein